MRAVCFLKIWRVIYYKGGAPNSHAGGCQLGFLSLGYLLQALSNYDILQVSIALALTDLGVVVYST